MVTSVPEAGNPCGKLNRGLSNVNLACSADNLGGILAVVLVLCSIDAYVFSRHADLFL